MFAQVAFFFDSTFHVCHTLILFGDYHSLIFWFSLAELRCLTPVTAQNTRSFNILIKNATNTKKGGKKVFSLSFLDPGSPGPPNDFRVKELARFRVNIKILNCLTVTWKPKITTIKESKDLTSMSMETLFRKLLSCEHELIEESHAKEAEKKRKGITLTVNSSKEDHKWCKLHWSLKA